MDGTTSIRRISANEVSHAVITAAMSVHTELGLGLLESTYTACLQHQLSEAGVRSAAQVGLPVVYHGVRLELGYRMDLVVEESVVVKIKSVDALSPVHHAQLLSYLKLSGKSVGLLINFNVVHLKDGIRQLRKRYRMAAARKTKASTTKDTEVHKGFRTRFSFVYLPVLCG